MTVKYNTKEVTHNGQRVVFVTRGRAKPFTTEEAEEFLGTKLERLEENIDRIAEVQKLGWTGVPDDRQRKVMFLKDMKFGIEYCINKYGATKEELIAEAQRIAPHFNGGI